MRRRAWGQQEVRQREVSFLVIALLAAGATTSRYLVQRQQPGSHAACPLFLTAFLFLHAGACC